MTTRYYVFNEGCGVLEGYFDTAKRYPPEHTNYTAVPPPSFAKGQVPCFDRQTQQWTVVEDHRGKPIFRGKDNYKQISETPRVPEGWSLEPRPTLAHELVDGVWKENADKKRELDAEAKFDADRAPYLQKIATAAAKDLTVEDLAIALGLRLPGTSTK